MPQHFLVIALIFSAVEVAAALQPTLFRQTEDKCACKNWKQAYQSGIQCGSGKEWEGNDINSLPSQYKMYSHDSAKELICKRFWEVLDTNRCINLHVSKNEGSWCYVHSSCKNLNGGSELSNQFSWKQCSREELKFSDYTLEEFYNFTQQKGIWSGGLDKSPHPASKIDERYLVNFLLAHPISRQSEDRPGNKWYRDSGTQIEHRPRNRWQKNSGTRMKGHRVDQGYNNGSAHEWYEDSGTHTQGHPINQWYRDRGGLMRGHHGFQPGFQPGIQPGIQPYVYRTRGAKPPLFQLPDSLSWAYLQRLAGVVIDTAETFWNSAETYMEIWGWK